MVIDKRAVSPIRNVSISVVRDKKDTYLKIAVPDLFYGNRKSSRPIIRKYAFIFKAILSASHEPLK
jgi:hypothetical protein